MKLKVGFSHRKIAISGIIFVNKLVNFAKLKKYLILIGRLFACEIESAVFMSFSSSL